MATHSLASVRLLQRQAALTSVEGGPRVFILGEADRLIAQESSQEAANALLKLLEEPPAGSLFLLTTVEARRLLPTMRSRAVPIRLGRLTDAEVGGFLKAHLKPAPSHQGAGAAGVAGRGFHRRGAQHRRRFGQGPASARSGGSRQCWRGQAPRSSGR